MRQSLYEVPVKTIDGKDATQENIMALATQFETAPETAAANQ